jgi:hypothetical protein
MATEIMVMTDDAQVEWREGSHVEDVLAGREGNEFGAFFWREDEWNIKFNAATWKMFWREECPPDRRQILQPPNFWRVEVEGADGDTLLHDEILRRKTDIIH